MTSLENILIGIEHLKTTANKKHEYMLMVLVNYAENPMHFDTSSSMVASLDLKLSFVWHQSKMPYKKEADAYAYWKKVYQKLVMN